MVSRTVWEHRKVNHIAALDGQRFVVRHVGNGRISVRAERVVVYKHLVEDDTGAEMVCGVKPLRRILVHVPCQPHISVCVRVRVRAFV